MDKGRPNRLHFTRGIPQEKTTEQIEKNLSWLTKTKKPQKESQINEHKENTITTELQQDINKNLRPTFITYTEPIQRSREPTQGYKGKPATSTGPNFNRSSGGAEPSHPEPNSSTQRAAETNH